jgi:hypothetical protein
MLQLMMGSTEDSTLTPRTPDSQDSIKRRIKHWDNPDMGTQIMITFTQAAQLVLKILKKCFEQKQMNFTYHVRLFWGKKNTMAWKQVSNQGNIFHSQMYILTAMIVLKLSSARTISEALCCTNTQHNPLSVRVRSQRRSELDQEEVTALMPKKNWQKERWHF